MTNLHRARSGIETTGPVPDDLLIVDAKTARVAAELPAGSGYRIALPKGRYQLIAVDGDDIRSMAIHIKDGFEQIAPAVGLGPSTGLRARGGLLIERPWTIRAGVHLVAAQFGRRRGGAAPFVQVTRATGGGHRVGGQIAGMVVPYQSTWETGVVGGVTVSGEWGLDLSSRPMWLGPMASMGVGYGGQTSRRRDVDGLGAWYGTNTDTARQWSAHALAQGGLGAEFPMGPVMLTTALMASLRVNEDPTYGRTTPGIGLRLGVGSRE